MKAHFYQDLRGEWRWRLVSPNGRVLADSAEGYTEQRGAEGALEKILGAARADDIEVVRDAPPG